jgi:hypothetical protein
LDYWTDRPDWAGYDGLRNWCAYSLFDKHEQNKDLQEFDGDTPIIDKALGLMIDTESHMEFWHLIAHRDIWFPGNYTTTYAIPGPDGRELCVGWQGPLFDALDLCNEFTWNASAQEIVDWGREIKKYEDGLEACAKYGLSLFYQAAIIAEDMKQPILIDY